ncbi:preprotein translocase subunit YajC [Cryobacterium mesophilum]|uniref:Preprotein translocase subunit YajC n=1 Tax=Terrimesophilobacter mesophilus TaxID=433647 RepID=A0A4R8V9N6_9MICO|nr:preprotein translocase subunit YajC [Terrimesophilobacter mesophilus]MBB5631857.1 preprotein translocase subunit YajC [Terrimesophilobacter mesophilus]TFB78770.1 preprotein translocase subunit YajC [Terrimesophilobacter mesophilus]
MDYTLILIAVVLAVFVFFQFRSSRKRQKDAAERLATLLPGVEVMTNFGLYGTLVSIDEEENLAFVEIAPKTIVKLHRQVILKAVDPVIPEETADEVAEENGPELNTSSAVPMTEPEYGERTKKPSRKKPASDSE